MAIVALGLRPSPARAGAPASQPADQPSLRERIDRGVAFLQKNQNPDGSWGTGTQSHGNEIMSMVPGSLDAFRIGATALCVMALREAGETSAHAKGLEYLITAPEARRDDGELLYNTWSHIYRLDALCIEMRTNHDPRIRQTAEKTLQSMIRYATYMGGWAYYDFEAHTQASSMGPTSFGTAAGLVALRDAREAGLEAPQRLIDLSLRRLEESRLPNGFFSYGSDYQYLPRLPANQEKGAVGRTQPANFALSVWRSKKVSADVIRTGLDAFFRDHMFLDMGRKRPYPHESWYQTSGYYYYFDHYYASRLIGLLPPDLRAAYTARLADVVAPHQEPDGSWWDYPMWDFHKPYGTAFAIMTLLRCEQGEQPSATQPAQTRGSR